MNVECPKCNRKYEVEDAYIPIGGAPIKCPNCGNIFGIYVEPIDIPLTPIAEENAPNPASTQQAAPPAQEPAPQQTIPPVQESVQQQPNPPVQEAAPTILGNSFETPPAPIQESPAAAPALGALGNLGQESQTESVPELGNINPASTTNPETQESAPSEPSADLGGFGNIQPAKANESTTPDLGAMMNQSTEPSQTEVSSQDPSGFGNIPLEESPAPDLGAMLNSEESNPSTEPPSADLGGFGNIQPDPSTPTTPEPTTPDIASAINQDVKAPPSPDLGSSIYTQPSPEIPSASTDIPEVKPEPAPSDGKKSKKKLGSNLFESLLAGFTLPDNFKNLPPNVQKNHKSSIKLARQLAKDILLYHKDDVERGLGSGNLKTTLKDEVEKSYKFYQQRVEPEIIQNSNYFTEALNKIIAKGQAVF